VYVVCYINFRMIPVCSESAVVAQVISGADKWRKLLGIEFQRENFGQGDVEMIYIDMGAHGDNRYRQECGNTGSQNWYTQWITYM